ncbi:TrkH family potassium uptake protein [Palleronia sediminis]|uniref:TrkH family potassium uptake protein n=1 Tax=Palleronia sediminis TaxID=2547833 RepID=A0A4R6AJV8_9RHOB|nr:potassium transporter TrkG [Palleronia sediminis]TDL83645.1 TrkH family potassium uptake protein [Palleronia sediminis]
MVARLKSLPFLLLLQGIGAVAMFVPAIYAFQVRSLHVSRSFFYSGLVFSMLFLLLAVAVSGRGGDRRARGQLLGLLGALTLLPVMLAVPFHESVPGASFFACWFEMVSSITTTGASLFSEPGRLPSALHLWRAMVGWMGGLLFWVSALAILAPLNLGGFEVVSTDMTAAGRAALRERRAGDAGMRLRRYGARLAPVYAGLTLALWAILVMTGLAPLEGAIIAMSTLSTSGIAPGGWQSPGVLPEIAIFVFLFFAVSRLTFRNDFITRERGYLLRDPEIRLALVLVLAIPGFLFLRHWLGAIETNEQENLGRALAAFWGAMFTTLSFLTTTGFEGSTFEQARFWSGLPTPGLVLMGLSIIGGGVATTAGGVKLLRIYALYKHGTREMGRLVHPSSVGGAGSSGRRLRREGAFVAWIFFMLFAMTIGAIWAALALTGLRFTEAAVITVAALSTNGPLAAVGGQNAIAWRELNTAAQVIVAATMVLGRLELLAIIALFNRDVWRG